MPFLFEKLTVYRKAIAFIDDTARVVDRIPRGYRFLASQLGRSALSIATNLAEGNGRFSKADRRHFFIIARGSTQECIPLLEIAARRGFLDEDTHNDLCVRLDEISRMINGLIKSQASAGEREE